VKLFLTLLLFISNDLYSIEIHGKVFDSSSNVEISYCNVYVMNSTTGTMTNDNGEFIISNSEGFPFSIIFHHIGYVNDTLQVTNSKSLRAEYTIKLKPRSIVVDELQIIADRYTRAERLILLAAEKKKQYLKRINNFQCISYNKIVLKQEVDPEKPKYALLYETISDLKWQYPNNWKEVIFSQRVSENLPKQIQLLNSYQDIDLTQDKIIIGGNLINNPVSETGLNYYTYSLVDSIQENDNKIFIIKIKPNINEIPAVSGQVFIYDSFFQIKKIDYKLNRFCNYQMFKDIDLSQEYILYKKDLILPSIFKMKSTFSFGILGIPDFDYIRVGLKSEYLINDASINIIDNNIRVKIDDSYAFDSLKVPILSADEKLGYAQIDSIVNNNISGRILTSFYYLFDIYEKVQLLPFGDFSDFYRYNRVEGNYLGVSYQDSFYSNNLRLKLNYGYGFADNKSKYIVNPSYSFSIGRTKFSVGYSKFDRVSSIEPEWELPLIINSLYGLVSNIDYYDYYYNKGNTINLIQTYMDHKSSIFIFFEKHYTAKSNVNYAIFSDRKFDKNMSIDDGGYNGIKLSYNYSTIEYKNSLFAKQKIEKPFSDFILNYEVGIKELGSISSYSKLSIRVSGKQNTYNKGNIFYQLSLGRGVSLPVQKLFELPTGSIIYQDLKLFRTLGRNSLRGEKKISLFVEHKFQDIFAKYNLSGLQSFDFILISNSGWVGSNSFTHKDIYFEAGIGIGNIFNFIRADFIWSFNNKYRKSDFAFNLAFEDISF
jgi:hypothetical protein